MPDQWECSYSLSLFEPFFFKFNLEVVWCNDIVIGLTLSLEAPLKFTINMRGLKTNDIYPSCDENLVFD